MDGRMVKVDASSSMLEEEAGESGTEERGDSSDTSTAIAEEGSKADSTTSADGAGCFCSLEERRRVEVWATMRRRAMVS